LNQSAPANIESTTRNLCSGVVVEWPLDLDLNCNETFPFHRVPIGRSLGDVPFFIEIHNEGEKIIAWSKSCTRRPTPYASCCHECGQIPSRLEKLANIATRAEKGTNYKYLNHKQLKELLVERTKENNDLKLQVFTTGSEINKSLTVFYSPSI
jgi:hypothetical protein